MTLGRSSKNIAATLRNISNANGAESLPGVATGSSMHTDLTKATPWTAAMPPAAAEATRWGAAAHRAEAFIGSAVECVVGVLIAVEATVIFVGVVSRYVFNASLPWSDELASTVFLWVAMLGAVVAYRRFGHIRMSVLIDAAAPHVRALFDALALACELAFVSLVLYPSVKYALGEVSVFTPALAISGFWKSLGIAVGLALILLLGVLRLGRSTKLAHFAVAMTFLAVVAGALALGTPLLTSIGNYKLIVFFVVLVSAGVLAGIPIGFVFGLASYAFLVTMTRITTTIVASRMEEGMSHVILLSVPLFILLGLLLEFTGIARAIVAFLASLIGHVRGGLQYVLIGAIYLVSGISGSKAADMAAVAPALFPEMIARGAKPGKLAALLAATGAQTETVPPSLVLITIGSVTGVSISALFAAGILPSLLLAAMLCVVVAWQFRREDLSNVKRATRGEILRFFALALPALPLPFLIRAAVVEGVATATEVSTLGIFYCLIYALAAIFIFHQKIALRRLWPALIETAALTGAILFIIGTATVMAWVLTQSGFSRQLVSAIVDLPGGALTFMASSIVCFILLGSVLEGIPAIVIFGPLFFPVARVLGIHEVQYAMVAVLAMGIGLFAPPLGVGFYTACVIGRVDPVQAMQSIFSYLLTLFLGVIVVAAVPWISTALLP
jgi:tripartite ATP-independent transporter DctM subunit